MHPLLADLLSRSDGLVDVRCLPPSLPRWAVANMVRGGHLVRFFPGVYGLPTADPVRAAGLYVDGRGALSHTTALTVWGFAGGDGRIHITVPTGRRLGAPGLIIHTRHGMVIGPPDVVRRNGLPVTALDEALVASWPLLRDGDRTAALLRAVNDRMTLPSRLALAIERSPRIEGHASLVRLVDALAAGCRSYLELFGLTRVFRGLGLVQQTAVQADGRTYYLDLFAPPERVNVELDGASWHSSDQQREADLRRDAALATLGILVVRFSYLRMMSDPAGARRQVLEILRTRQ